MVESMGEEFVYSIDPDPSAPQVDAEFLGVAIAGEERVPVDGEWMLRGLFQLPPAELEVIDEQPHRALVLVAVMQGGWYTDSPLRQKIFFADDLHAAGPVTRGYFAFDLFSLFEDRVPGTYTLSVSLGEHLSNSLRVEVG
jgi:hypothetical protein